MPLSDEQVRQDIEWARERLRQLIAKGEAVSIAGPETLAQIETDCAHFRVLLAATEPVPEGEVSEEVPNAAE